ncbi:alpha/beta hydrolase family protein [Aestuariibaculum suncheonense]|uniref:Alpha/beta fold hydrolase n=1 Tax=Aestuariibaculum suncheonense TaxID=1028745 RepID=A0A8J6QI53_9FLAO|nr:alpha/beta fold hydrolase [Aestuariibaculum suncheonense]MBD0836808.1 alpha/beta fold hydrolase [Aestuariibaculum suncheonense]
MLTKQQTVIDGQHQKPIFIDATFTSTKINQPIIIFCHGYKGFKDWGAWNLMANAFAEQGFYFLKFNFSHNGSTIEQPIDFPDLQAFGNNNYTKELDDLNSVINWVYNTTEIQLLADKNNIFLMGHSRGGGITLIKAEEDSRVKKLISLASVSDFKSRMTRLCDVNQWREAGVTFIENSRTKQQIPHYYQFYEDFIANQERFNIQRAAKNLNIPHLIMHGVADTSVSIKESENIHKWNTNSKFVSIENADHVFGTKHPWNHKELPPQLNTVIQETVNFLNE